MFLPNLTDGERIISTYTGVILRTVNGTPMVSDAFLAFAAEKKRGFKGDPVNVDPLLPQYQRTQYTVQSPGTQAKGANGS